MLNTYKLLDQHNITAMTSKRSTTNQRGLKLIKSAYENPRLSMRGQTRIQPERIHLHSHTLTAAPFIDDIQITFASHPYHIHITFTSHPDYIQSKSHRRSIHPCLTVLPNPSSHTIIHNSTHVIHGTLNYRRIPNVTWNLIGAVSKFQIWKSNSPTDETLMLVERRSFASERMNQQREYEVYGWYFRWTGMMGRLST